MDIYSSDQTERVGQARQNEGGNKTSLHGSWKFPMIILSSTDGKEGGYAADIPAMREDIPDCVKGKTLLHFRIGT